MSSANDAMMQNDDDIISIVRNNTYGHVLSPVNIPLSPLSLSLVASRNYDVVSSNQ
jgi:hypothetical protein